MKQIFRRVFFLLLPLVLLLPAGAASFARGGSARGDLLPRVRTYEGRFSDVTAGDWFFPYVSTCYEHALIDGRGRGFAPDAAITVAESLAISARIRAAYAGEPIPSGNGAWYEPYAAYLSSKGLPDALLTDYAAPATRAQLAGILSAALPDECFDGVNALLVTDSYASGGFISDVGEYTPYQPQILWMYRQGLLVGVDASGSYRPEAAATRAEAAAVAARIIEPARRIRLEWAVAPAHTAAGTTLASLVPSPASVKDAPGFNDSAAIDALVRQMLSQNRSSISLRYPRVLTRSDAAALADAFTVCVKSYCEQMYNSVLCRAWSDGTVTLTFSSTACKNEQLAQYRAAAMEKAIEVHDLLWESGQLTADMTQLEIARVYFLWLCDHCEYDRSGAETDSSLSHIAYRALLDGLAVCDGYTGAYNLFLKLEGIDCHALHNDTHIWTVATLDGAEYHIDTTWGDQAGRTAARYFGMTASESYALHPW